MNWSFGSLEVDDTVVQWSEVERRFKSVCACVGTWSHVDGVDCRFVSECVLFRDVDEKS